MASRADLLILDEPTAGLDPVMEQAFRVSVREAKDRGQTIFLSSHVLSEVEALCDRVAILRRGRLVEVGTLARAPASVFPVRKRHVLRDGTPELPPLPGVSVQALVRIDSDSLFRGTSGR